MDLQSYSYDYFSKISRTLFDFLNNTYCVSLFQRSNLLIIWSGVSCFSVTLFYSTLFCCGGKANFVRFTLFYSTLLTLTHGRNGGQRNEYTRWAWAGGTGSEQFPINKIPFVCCVILFVIIVFRPIRFGGSIFCMRQCLVSHHSEKICSSVCVVSHHS